MLEKIEPMEFIEDDEIIRLFHERKREQEAFRLLVNKYKERLYWHIRKIVINHDDTDDLLQNVFVKDLARIARVSQRFETIYLDVPDCNQRIAEFSEREEPESVRE